MGNTNKPGWLDNKVATVLGVIFFPQLVIFSYRINTYILGGEPMSGGRLFWRNFGWSFLTSIPFVGLIYGLVKLEEIVKARNDLWELTNK